MGVRYLFGAYDVGADKLWGVLRAEKDASVVLALLKDIRRRYPADVQRYIVMDNLSTHWTPQIRAWALTNHDGLLATPTYASWLNRMPLLGICRTGRQQQRLPRLGHPRHSRAVLHSQAKPRPPRSPRPRTRTTSRSALPRLKMSAVSLIVYARGIEGTEEIGVRAQKRGRPASLTDVQIVDAVLKLVAETSFAEVSMRAVASELGTSVMTLYNYVPSKDALHDLVVNHLLRPVRVPGPDEGTWEERIFQLECDAVRALAAHPGMRMQGRRDTVPEQSARLAEGVLSILASGGFSSDESALIFTTIYTFVAGQFELDAIQARSGQVEATLAGVMEPARLSRDEAFDFGLDAIIEGLKAKIGAQRSRRTSRVRRSRS
jgi:AcrR family transcriptional regulator